MKFHHASAKAACICAALVSVTPVLAQKGNPGGRPTAIIPPSGTVNAGSASQTPRRPVLVNGHVMFDDGRPADLTTRIERVCGGVISVEAHVNGKGDFAFEVGQNEKVDEADIQQRPGSQLGTAPQSGPIGTITGGMAGCEIRAVFPGYSSDVYEIPLRVDPEGIRVGTLILHRLGEVKGTTLSITTAMAPRQARHDVDKGELLFKKGRYDEAAVQFRKAVDLDTNYANAWFDLGSVLEKNGQSKDARHAYESAIKADDHYVSPYLRLAFLATQDKDWRRVIDLTARALDLNPVEFPDAYWLNALAHYRLEEWKPAITSARELIKIDSGHQYPAAESILGGALFQVGDVRGSMEHLRAYLDIAPDSADAPRVRAILTAMAITSR